MSLLQVVASHTSDHLSIAPTALSWGWLATSVYASLCTDGMQTALCVGNWCLWGQSLCTDGDGDGIQKRREFKLDTCVRVTVRHRAWAHTLIRGVEEERFLELMSPAQRLVHGQRCDKTSESCVVYYSRMSCFPFHPYTITLPWLCWWPYGQGGVSHDCAKTHERSDNP